MTGDATPTVGAWVTFMPTSPESGRVGQVAAVLEPNEYGRTRFRVEFWRERKKGKALRQERDHDTVSADRLLGVLSQAPPGIKPLVLTEPAEPSASAA